MDDVKINITGLKCDHCTYRDDTIQFSDYSKYINAPCPDCGENLLTEDDYNECLKIYGTVKRFNKIINVLKWLNPAHYWRLVFGDNRKIISIKSEFPKFTEIKGKK